MDRDRFELVRSLDGLRCITTGTVDGAPCDPSDYVLDDSGDFGGGVVEAQELTGTLTSELSMRRVRAGDQVYILKMNSPPDPFAGFDPFIVRGRDVVMFPAAGRLGQRMGELATPLPAACAAPANSCAGLPADLIVPLESEITEDSDPYENSWKHYLELADQMSAEADALGEELVRAGLELDVRGEAARDELEAMCGGVINVPDIFGAAEAGGGLPEDAIAASPDPSLESCLPSNDPDSPTATLDWVTLGEKNVCAWVAKDFGAPCVCPSGVAADFCSLACPVAATGDGCTDAFPTLPAEGYDLIESQFALGLITDPGDPGYRGDPDDPEEGGPAPIDCLPLAELRWNRDLSGLRDDPDYFGEELTDAERAQRIADLQEQPWFGYAALDTLMTNSAYDEDFRDDFDISVTGAGIISTRDADVYPCVLPDDAAVMRRASNLFDPSWGIDCEDPDGSRAETRALMRRMRRAFGTLGLLTGGISGTIARSWLAPVATGCRAVEGSDTERVCDEVSDPEIGYRLSCAGSDQGCRCLIDGEVEDEEGVTRYGNVLCSQGARFDHTVWTRWENEAGFGAGHANDLWGIGQSLRNCDARNVDEQSVLDVLCSQPETGGDPADGTRFRFPWNEEYIFGGCNPEMCRQSGGQVDPDDGVCYCRTDPDLGIFSEPADLLAPEAGEVTESADARSVTHEDVYDALALACYLELEAQGGCPFFDPRNPPPIPSVGSVGDLKKVEHFVDCAARSIAQSAGRGMLAHVPREVAEAVAEHRMMQPYPEYRGEYLDALVAFQTDLEQVGSLATNIQYQLQEASLATAAARNSLLINQAQRELRQLQASAALLASAASAIANAYITKGASMPGLVEGYALNQEIQAAQTEIGALERSMILTEYVGQVGDVLAKLSDLDGELRETYYRLNADLNRLESVQSQALSAAARAAFADSDESGRLFPVTTVMRRRYNTLRIRYERARDRARKMAFVARRAIEQRFGVDLESLSRDLTLIEAPATWARDVCTFEGIDYQRIREAQVPNADGTPVEELVPDNYVDGYLGDYVQRLRLFVESYPFDFPFQDGDDLAVISIRDDLYQTKVACEVAVPNLLASSESIARDPGGESSWQVAGCPEAEGVTQACLAIASSPHPEIEGRGVNRVTDLGDTLAGVVQQDVFVGVAPATLLLSWQDAFLTPGEEGVADLGVDHPVHYGVTLERLEGSGDEAHSRGFGPQEDTWSTRGLSLAIREPGTIRVTIDPSDPEFREGERGDVWLSELQLEILDRDRARLEDDAPPSIYMPTTRSGVSVMEVCPDVRGDVLRDRFFHRRCEDLCTAGFGSCGDDERAATTTCFYESTFGLDLGEIERGEIIPSGQIAVGNYNYRHDQLAVNLVGTNVRDCADSEEPATCYSNAFVPFTLVHEGEDIPIRNHDGETLDFDFERGFIEHGKALTTEAVLTNPLTGAAETLLAPYYKEELRGRPLAGHYTLRIWEDPALRWENVEDVQIVFRYRYWTRFER